MGRLRLPSPRQGTSDLPPPKSLPEVMLDDMEVRVRILLGLMGFKVPRTTYPQAEEEP